MINSDIQDYMYDLFIYCHGSRHIETENLAPEQDSRFRESGFSFAKQTTRFRNPVSVSL